MTNRFALIQLSTLPLQAQRKRIYEETTVPTWLSHFEKNLIHNGGGDGYFVGDSVSFHLLELCPNSSLAGYQAVLTLDMLGFSYCHMECQDLIHMQLKIQTKL